MQSEIEKKIEARADWYAQGTEPRQQIDASKRWSFIEGARFARPLYRREMLHEVLEAFKAAEDYIEDIDTFIDSKFAADLEAPDAK